MSEDYLVSIIIPAYNASDYICRSINSCLAQTYSNIEILVVNDGSTDDTEQKVKSMAADDKRIKLISVSNGGVSKSRNIGIENATGEYITFLDSDDCLCENAVEKLVYFTKEHSADITLCNSRKILGSSEQTVFKSNFNKDKIPVSIFEKDEFLIQKLEDRATGYGACANLYKKSFLKNIRFPEDIKVHEDDFFMFLCALESPKVVYAKTVIYIIFQTANSSSRTAFSEKFFDIIKSHEKKVAIIKEKRPEYASCLHNLKIKANISLLVKLASTKDKKYKTYKKQYVREIIKNKKFFIPETIFDKKFFKIVIYRLYPIYEIIYRLKNK